MFELTLEIWRKVSFVKKSFLRTPRSENCQKIKKIAKFVGDVWNGATFVKTDTKFVFPDQSYSN